MTPNTIPTWFVVLVTTAAQMVVAMSNIVLSTIAPKVAESLGVAPVLVGYHVGLTFGAAAVASVYGGIVVLSLGAARTTQISMVSTVIGLVLLALPHVGFIALGSLFIGTGMGFASPAASYPWPGTLRPSAATCCSRSSRPACRWAESSSRSRRPCPR
jgi:hypothetical protein